jgi:hypothetical protein
MKTEDPAGDVRRSSTPVGAMGRCPVGGTLPKCQGRGSDSVARRGSRRRRRGASERERERERERGMLTTFKAEGTATAVGLTQRPQPPSKRVYAPSGRRRESDVCSHVQGLGTQVRSFANKQMKGADIVTRSASKTDQSLALTLSQPSCSAHGRACGSVLLVR